MTHLQERNSPYISHITPFSAPFRDYAATLMDFFLTKNIDVKYIVFIGCNSTAAITWRKGGTIRVLDEHLQRLLQLIVSRLHGIDLPLRHLIEELDCKTIYHVSFRGLNCKQSNQFEKQPSIECK